MTKAIKLPRIRLGQLGTSFPNLKIATYNTCALSWKKGSQERHRRILTNISKLLAANHILLLQETKLKPFEDQALKAEFPHHEVFFNNSPNGNSAGQLILVQRGLLNLYNISNIFPHFDAATRSPDPAAPDLSPAHGHIQGLLLEPKENNPIKRSINLVNVYLHGPGPQQIEELNLLSQLDSANISVVAGDFNFTEHRTDSTNDESKIFIRGLAKDTWDKASKQLRLREVSQPVHTHYTPGAKALTSRIDRIYLSISTAELALISPRTFVSPIRYCPIAAHRALDNPAARKKILDPTTWRSHSPSPQRNPAKIVGSTSLAGWLLNPASSITSKLTGMVSERVKVATKPSTGSNNAFVTRQCATSPNARTKPRATGRKLN
jgi:exonuclease III